jgi:hypothetical protein
MVLVAGFTMALNHDTRIEKKTPAPYAYTPAQVLNGATHAVNSSFQISDQRAAMVCYNVTIGSAAVLVTGSRGNVILETSPDNSTWTTVVNAEYGVNSGLVITSGCSVSVFGGVPRGYWVRVRTANIAGTPTYSSAVGTEILIN